MPATAAVDSLDAIDPNNIWIFEEFPCDEGMEHAASTATLTESWRNQERKPLPLRQLPSLRWGTRFILLALKWSTRWSQEW